MGIARRDLDWKTQFETAITSERAEEIRKSRPPMEEETCTMCGAVCSLKGVAEYYEEDLKNSRKRSYKTAVSSNGF
jgi:phosphomethylpyrimidine synthase